MSNQQSNVLDLWPSHRARISLQLQQAGHSKRYADGAADSILARLWGSGAFLQSIPLDWQPVDAAAAVFLTPQAG